MALKKLCPQCLYLCEIYEVLCPKCGSDLLQAQEVFEQPVQDPDSSNDTSKASDTSSRRGPTTESADRVTEQLPCDCPIPGGDPGATCFACDGLIVSERRTFSNAPARPEPVNQVSIWLPNGVRREIGAGILLGRDLAHAGVETATSLATLMGISRIHAWLCRSGSGVIVVDLGSRNGTWLGSERLQPWKSRLIDATNLPVEIRLGARGLIQIRMETTE